MAGPGIRYYHMARVLARYLPTTLAVPEGSSTEIGNDAFPIVFYSRSDWSSIAECVDDHEICLLPSDTATNFPELATTNAYIIVDGYDPLMVEWLSLASFLPLHEQTIYWKTRQQQLTAQFEIADFFICASERQRDWWIGLLEARGRINPPTFRANPSLRHLIDVVPYGLREEQLPKARPIIKGNWSGIQATDHLLLWGGGLWPWLDALTAVRAVAQVWQQRQDVKLVFPGSKHPNPAMVGMPTQNEAVKQLAMELGIFDKAVFFGEWLPYADWAHVLQECSIALSLHYDSAETRLAFRSRMLEYIWAGLPIVATCGDATSEIVTKYNLGYVVSYEDADAVASAIHQLLHEKDRSHRNFAQARAELAWERCVEPLARYCANPWRAADKTMLHEVKLNNTQLAVEIENLQQRILYLEQAQKESGLLFARQQTELEDSQKLITALQAERDVWQKLAAGYANGKVMRLMNWMNKRIRR